MTVDDASSSDESSLDQYGLQWIKENDPWVTELDHRGDDMQNVTDEDWTKIGRAISNNTHLTSVNLTSGALSDHKMSFLFRGLQKSSSIDYFGVCENHFSVAGLRSMLPFLQNANNLTCLNVSGNYLQSEGFNLMFQSLRDSPIEVLCCNDCSIQSIDIDGENIPKHLKNLILEGNYINAEGCRELAKLLRTENSNLESLLLSSNEIDDDGVEILAGALLNNTTLKKLDLMGNEIGDDGVEILVDAVQNNTSLQALDLRENDVSNWGQIMLLKLVGDVSSIKATLQSNHTLEEIRVKDVGVFDPEDIIICINMATSINKDKRGIPDAAGREKVIRTHLHSVRREGWYQTQGVDHSVYSEIDPLHLPEVLSLIGGKHGWGELFNSLKSSVMTLLSTVNVTEFLQQERAYHAAKVAEHAAIVAELDAKLALMGVSSEGKDSSKELEHRSNKRCRE